MLAAICLAPVVIVCLVAVVVSVFVSRKKIENVPHPKPLLPILGNGHLFINNTPSGILLLIKDLVKQHGKRFQVMLGVDHVFFTTEVKDVEVERVESVISR